MYQIAGAGEAGFDGDYLADAVVNGAPSWVLDADHGYFWDGVHWRLGKIGSETPPYYYNESSPIETPPAVLTNRYGAANPIPTLTYVADEPPAPEYNYSDWSDPANITPTEAVNFATGKVTGLLLSQVSNHVLAGWDVYGGADGYQIAWKEAAAEEYEHTALVAQTNWSGVIGGGSVLQYGTLYTFRVRAFYLT